MFNEIAQPFEVAGQACLGVCHIGNGDKHSVGVLLVVGGPQYRVGSHRQFVQLSRALAAADVASFRFDYRGMGDSNGSKQAFDAIDEDIRAALDAFSLASGLSRFVIWGLCDAASAAMMYACQDERVVGLVLMNPWLKSQAAQGQAMLRHYYVQRLLSKAFWRKLLAGGVNFKASLKDAKGFAQDAAATSPQDTKSYQSRMLDGMQHSQVPVCLILSGNDLTAREFEQIAFKDKNWRQALRQNLTVHRLDQADHTFSCRDWKRQVEAITLTFVQSLG